MTIIINKHKYYLYTLFERCKYMLFIFLVYLYNLYNLFKKNFYIDKIVKYIQNYNGIKVYVLEGTSMIPWEKSTHTSKNTMVYAILNINEKEKILVFDNTDTLRLQYNILRSLVEKKAGHFGHYLEAITSNEVDIVEQFNKYDDNDNTFFVDITKYALKPKDLYDFHTKTFLIEPNSTLDVFKMSLDTVRYKYDEPFFKQAE